MSTFNFPPEIQDRIAWFAGPACAIVLGRETILRKILSPLNRSARNLEHSKWLNRHNCRGDWPQFTYCSAAWDGELALLQFIDEHYEIEHYHSHLNAALLMQHALNVRYLLQRAPYTDKGWLTHERADYLLVDAINTNNIRIFEIVSNYICNHLEAPVNAPHSFDRIGIYGNLEIFSKLHSVFADASTSFYQASLNAAYHGHLHLLQYLHTKTSTLKSASQDEMGHIIDAAVSNGYINVVKYIHTEFPDATVEPYTMATAARRGDMEMLKYLHENNLAPRPADSDTSSPFLPSPLSCSITSAAASGHLDVIKYLHEIGRDEYISTSAVDTAADHGHAEVVAWLLENRTEGGTTRALTTASRYTKVMEILQKYATRLHSPI